MTIHSRSALPQASPGAEALSEGIVPLDVALAVLASPVGLEATEKPVTVELLLWTLETVARVLSVSRRTLERERAAGRFPPPDIRIGKRPLWRPMTVQSWIDKQGDGQRGRR
jgi:hypothetical protein